MWDQSNLGIRVAREELKRLIPLLEVSRAVVAEALESAPELRGLTVAASWDAKAASLLEDARRPDVVADHSPTEAEIEARRDEAERCRKLWRSVEEHLCEAGVLAFRAKDRVKSENAKAWKKLLDHHARHREADRKAKLAELRKSLRELKKDVGDEARRGVTGFFDDVTSREDAVREHASALRESRRGPRAALEQEIARLKALPLDVLCASREVLERPRPSAPPSAAPDVRAARLAELNALHLAAMHHRSALEARARERAHARGQFFDDVTSREDAVNEEGGAELEAARAEERRLENEVRRVARLPASDFER